MIKRMIKSITAVILSPIFFTVLPAPAALASAESILEDDAEVEGWMQEIQADIIFFASVERAYELGGKAAKKTKQNNWGNEKKWAQRYVLLHNVVAQTNDALFKLIAVNNQPDDFPDKNEFFDTFFGFMMGGVNQIGPMMEAFEKESAISDDEKDIVKILGFATKARVFCTMSKIASNAPDGLNERGDKHYKTAIKALKNASPETVANIVNGVKLANIAMDQGGPLTKANLVNELENQRDLICGA